MMFQRILLAGVAATLLAGGASASSFTQVANLGAAVGANSVAYANFNDASPASLPGPTSYPSPGPSMTFISSSNTLNRYDTTNYIDSNYVDGTKFIAPCEVFSGTGCSASGTLTISFGLGTMGFTLSADDFDTFGNHTFTAQAFNGSTLLGSLTTSSVADSGSSPAVLAAISSTLITSVVISDDTGAFVVGNVGAVPEPASLALLGAGVATMMGWRRRSRR
jgi:hypothetical protein